MISSWDEFSRWFTESLERNIIALIIVLGLFYFYRYKRAQVRKSIKAKNWDSFVVLHSVEKSVVKGSIRFFYELPKAKKILFRIVDFDENEVKILVDSEQKAGNYPLDFDTTQLKNGVYFYQLITDKQRISKKLEIINDTE